MVLAAILEDFPLFNRRLRCPTRPVTNILDFFHPTHTTPAEEDREMNRMFHHELPAFLLEIGGPGRNATNRKRKLPSESESSTSSYEPKSKVRVTTDDKFQVTLDTSNYQPDEIVVKVVDDKLAISAKHETKRDDVYEFHEMYRCFDLPEGVDPSTVASKISAIGQLTIEAPVVKLKELTNERVIPIVVSKDSSLTEKGENEDVVSTSNEKKE